MARKVVAGNTFGIYFTTSDAAGGAVAPSSAFEAADVDIYKDGSATQRTSTSGWTMTSPFDSVTGLHLFEIDLSDNTDAGFYAIGSQYDVVITPDETVDGQTVAAVLATFVITDGAEYYPDGYIHVDSANGVSGTVWGVNGTIANPVASLADARTMAEAVDMRRIWVQPGSSVTAASAFDDYEINGQNYTLDLGTQSFSGTVIRNAAISTSTYSGVPEFYNCGLTAVTGPGGGFVDCQFNSSFTANGSAAYTFINCHGIGDPQFDFGSGVGNTTMRFFRWSGGIDFRNLGDTGIDVAEVEGNGSITLNANCTGGTLEITGVFDLTDNSATTTIDQSNRIDPSNILREVSTEPTAAPVLGTNTLREVLEWVAHFHLNEINQTSSQVRVRDAADTTNIATATYSNDGVTVVRSKFS